MGKSKSNVSVMIFFNSFSGILPSKKGAIAWKAISGMVLVSISLKKEAGR